MCRLCNSFGMVWKVHFLSELFNIFRLYCQKSICGMNLIHFITTNDPQYYEDCLSLARLVYLPVSIMIGNAYCWMWLKRHIQRMLGYFHVCFLIGIHLHSLSGLHIYVCLGILCSLSRMTVYVHCKFFWHRCFWYKET